MRESGDNLLQIISETHKVNTVNSPRHNVNLNRATNVLKVIILLNVVFG